MFPRLSAYLPTAALAFLIFYFGFHALTGERGLLRARERREAAQQQLVELRALKAERQALETRARYLRNDNLSADLVAERAQARLGFVDPRDYVIRLTAGRG
ncbi:MAG: septum formation initiator family protein [Caulobacteraceae bacterium]|nr:septum formation initiator family protein [Caulobacteraceae bacterium]